MSGHVYTPGLNGFIFHVRCYKSRVGGGGGGGGGGYSTGEVIGTDAVFITTIGPVAPSRSS